MTTGYNIREGSIELARRIGDAHPYLILAGDDEAEADTFDAALVAARTLVLEDGHDEADTYLGDRLVATSRRADVGEGILHRYYDVDRRVA